MLRNRYFYQEQSRDAPVSTLIQHLTESFSLCSKTREGKKKKKYRLEKEEMKLFLPVDDMIVYIEMSKDYTTAIQELVINYSKVASYKVT